MSRRRVNADGGMAEAELQRHVLGCAAFYGWLAYHTHDSRRSQRGFPDLVLVRPPELLFVELKTDRGRTTPEQDAWLEALEVVERAVAVARGACVDFSRGRLELIPDLAVEAHVWRPRDLNAAHDRLARGRIRQEPLGQL